MDQNNIYEHFKFYFSNCVKYVDNWYPINKNSIFLKLNGIGEFIFTYKGDGKFILVPARKD